MKNRMKTKESNILVNFIFAVPLCTFAISILIDLLIHKSDIGDSNSNNLIGIFAQLAAVLSIICIVFFVMCLVYLKNKEVPLHKKLIGAVLNIGAFLFAMYVMGAHF